MNDFEWNLEEEYLAHHGVQGQKWGIRRYQNPDGTLTTAGKARIKHIYAKDSQMGMDKKWADQEIRGLQKAGVIKGTTTDQIKKGSIVGRYSNNNKELLNKRKYAYVTDTDKRAYKSLIKEGGIGTKGSKDIYNYRLEAKKDLKIANQDEVLNYVLDKYGDRKTKEIFKEYKNLDLRNNANKVYALQHPETEYGQYLNKKLPEDQKNEKWAGDYAFKLRNEGHKALNNILYQNETAYKDISNYYIKKGYDAIVDIEDYYGGFEYPIILLDPSNSVSIKSTRRIKESHDE